MTPWLLAFTPWLTLAAALGAATMAGLLFAFSNFVMRALQQLPPAHGMEAMQKINVEILNPVFLALFFGTPALCALIVIAGLNSVPGRVYLLAGAICYILGVLGVTMLFNVPLNNALATTTLAAASDKWPQYVEAWLRWNHVRTILAALSAVLLLIGARICRPQ